MMIDRHLERTESCDRSPAGDYDATAFGAAPRSEMDGHPPEHPAPTAPGPPDPDGAGGFTPEERERLFADFQPLVRRLIRQYGGDGELKQDLTGEIYYQFCTLLKNFDPNRGIPLRAYLVRTLTASVYTYARSQWRRQHREVSLEATLDSSPPALHSGDPSHQWDRNLLLREVLAALPEAIAQLPLRQRQVLILRYYDSESFDRIAERLHIRPATARSLLRHGLNNLRRRIGASHPSWD